MNNNFVLDIFSMVSPFTEQRESKTPKMAKCKKVKFPMYLMLVPWLCAVTSPGPLDASD